MSLIYYQTQEICEEAWPLLLELYTVHGAGRQLTEKDMTSTLNPGEKRWLAEAKPRPCAQWSNLRILFLTKTAFEGVLMYLCFLKPYLCYPRLFARF